MSTVHIMPIGPGWPKFDGNTGIVPPWLQVPQPVPSEGEHVAHRGLELGPIRGRFEQAGVVLAVEPFGRRDAEHVERVAGVVQGQKSAVAVGGVGHDG